MSQVLGLTVFSAVLIRCQVTPWDRNLANDRQWEKNQSRARFAHQSDVHDIVVLLSLGLLVLWTIGPLAVFIVYHIPPLRRFLGLDDPIK